MLQGLLKELKPSKEESPPIASTKTPFRLDSLSGACRLASFEVALQITHGVWLHWNILDIFADCQSSISPATLKTYLTSSFRLTEQEIHLGSADAKATRTTLSTIPRSGIKIALPGLTVLGHFSDSNLKAFAQLEYFKLSLKPQYFDDILLV